jgi:adenylate cyclase
MACNVSLIRTDFHGRGTNLVFSGRPEEGLTSLRTSIRLDPRDTLSAIRLLHIASALYFSRKYEAAVEAAKQAIRSYPAFPLTYRWLTAALAQAGRIDEAKEALEQAIAIAPASFDMYVRGRAPWMRPEDHAHILEGLRKAGLREG